MFIIAAAMLILPFAIVGTTSAMLLLWTWRGARSMYPRCPRCGYALVDGVPGVRCPECGVIAQRLQHRERTRLQRTCARISAALIAISGCGLIAASTMRDWPRRFPTIGLIAILPYAEEEAYEIACDLEARLRRANTSDALISRHQPALRHWQNRVLAKQCATILMSDTRGDCRDCALRILLAIRQDALPALPAVQHIISAMDRGDLGITLACAILNEIDCGSDIVVDLADWMDRGNPESLASSGELVVVNTLSVMESMKRTGSVSAEAASSIERWLCADVPAVVRAAADALGTMGNSAASTASSLGAIAQSAAVDLRTRAHAGAALKMVVGSKTRSLDGAKQGAKERWVSILGQIAAEAAEDLKSEEQEKRVEALGVLWLLDHDAKQEVEAIQAALTSADEVVRVGAARVLLRCTGATEETIATFRDIGNSDPSSQVRVEIKELIQDGGADLPPES